MIMAEVYGVRPVELWHVVAEGRPLTVEYVGYAPVCVWVGPALVSVSARELHLPGCTMPGCTQPDRGSPRAPYTSGPLWMGVR
jgi:hypothetical protein